MIGTTRLAGPDDEDLILVYDHAARLTVEDVADMPFGDAAQQALNGRLRRIGECLYAGLQRHHPKLSLEEAHAIVGKAIEGGGSVSGIQHALLKAMTRSMPDEVEGENPPKAPSGTGTRSSAPGAKKASTRSRSGSKPRAASPQP